MRRFAAGTIALAGVAVVAALSMLSAVPAPHGWSVPATDAAPPNPAAAAAAAAAAVALGDGKGAEGGVSSEAAAVVTTGDASRVDRSWSLRVARLTGIPERSLLAYAGAANALAAEQPGCHLGWSTLAGLGAVESHHGTMDGRTVGADGVVSPAIVGPRLDGTDFAAVPDTDGGRLDGDPVWDRAVGPFQFLPETWWRWGADGSGDGRADPQQLDDAALAAGRYLCSHGDLAQPTTWRAAVFAYNHLDSYVDQVAQTANAYAAEAR